ncbi:MAG TPA: PilZ domain-containing protein [Gemmataceae bacterium]|nr:PilZ domain-containing protein [Gemmataceae bacterium]
MKPSLRNKLSVLIQRRLQNERRGCKRLVPVHRTLCLIQPAGESDWMTAVVDNLSHKGVALLVEREYAPGTVLPVLLVNASHTFSLAVEMKVVRSSRVGHDKYLIAGPFARVLLHDEVVPFIL